VSGRTRAEYEELERLIGEAKEAGARVQDMLMDMFSALDPESRQLPTRYDEQALDLQLALQRLEEELRFERQNDLGATGKPEDLR